MKKAPCFNVIFKEYLTSVGVSKKITITADNPVDAQAKARDAMLREAFTDLDLIDYYKSLLVTDITFNGMVFIDE